MSKSKSFKIPYGERGGDLLHISAVGRGLACDCVCPVCKDSLIARKGCKTKHHFAHYPGANCSAETVLHQLGKRLLHDRIAAAITDGHCLPLSWQCVQCRDRHDGNLVKLATGVRMELDLGMCRPDVALIKADGSPAAFVEVVVSHKPAENVLAYVVEHDVTLVEFRIHSADDLECIAQSQVLTPTKVGLCTRPKCSLCKRHLYKKMLHVVDGECWKCEVQIKIAMLNIEGMMEGPENFCEHELSVARQYGAILKENFSRPLGEKYVSNTCPHCGTFVGQLHLHDYWDLMTPENGHQTGLICMECNKHY